MAQFIERPNYLADALSHFVSDQQVQRLQDSIKEYEKRKKRQRATAIGVGAAAGAVGGLALAPALGFAGAPGSAALAGITPAAEAAITGPVFAGTVGSLGAGGGLSGLGALTAGLGGAAIGGRLGQQLADEDYAGAIATGASTVAGLASAKDAQSIYGFQPTKEDRASLAAQAARLGTTLGALEYAARQPGGQSVMAQLGIAEQADLSRDVERAYLLRGAGELAERDAAAADQAIAIQESFNVPGYAPELDDPKIAESQEHFGPVLESARVNAETGNRAGRPLGEQTSLMGRIQRQMYDGARRGRQVRRPPPNIGVDPKTGETIEVPWGKPYWEDTTTLMVPRRDAKGQINYFPKTVERSEIAIEMPDGAVYKSSAQAGTDPAGRQWRRTKDGIAFELGAKERRDKFLADNVVTKDGEVRTSEEMSQLAAAYDSIGRQGEVGDAIAEVHKNLADVTPEQSVELAKQVNVLWPTKPPDEIVSMLSDISIAAVQNVQANLVGPPAELAPPVEAAPPPTPPPPGSAAAAEESGRRAGQAARKIPGAVAGAVAAAPKAAFEAAEKVGSAGVGFMEGLLGIEETTPEGRQATRFAQIQKQNIEAGIDDPVIVVREDGSLVQVIKGTLTPQRIAELKQNGFTIPGFGE